MASRCASELSLRPSPHLHAAPLSLPHTHSLPRSPARSLFTTKLPPCLNTPPRQALGHRPRHCLQPRHRARRPLPHLRPDLPARQDGQHQGGVPALQGGQRRRRRLGHLVRRRRPPELRRRRPHQRHRHPVLQGRRLPRRPHLCRHRRPDRTFCLALQLFVALKGYCLTDIAPRAVPRPDLQRKEAPRHRRRQRRRQAVRDGRPVHLPHLVGNSHQPL